MGWKASARARGHADSGPRCSDALACGAACVGACDGGGAGAKRLLSEFAGLPALEMPGTLGKAGSGERSAGDGG